MSTETEKQNAVNQSTAETQKNLASRLFQNFSRLVERFFPNLSAKYPLISRLIVLILTAVVLALIYFVVTLSVSSCGTTTKALVRNNQAKTTITITTTNEPSVVVDSTANPNISLKNEK